ncbi:MAG: 6-phosphogluconolactonase [Gammaproteobacteria bacterium]
MAIPAFIECTDGLDAAHQALIRVDALAREAIEHRGCFKIALAGGGSPAKLYALLAEQDWNWENWRVYYGDERCLPVDHPDRNSVLAREHWLDPVDFPAQNHFPMPAELGPESGAERYRELIDSLDIFDLVLLGVGEDAHTASLFPGHEHASNQSVVAVHGAPKPPPERISLSYETIIAGRSRLVLTGRSGKESALAAWQTGADVPIGRATAGDGETLVFVWP